VLRRSPKAQTHALCLPCRTLCVLCHGVSSVERHDGPHLHVSSPGWFSNISGAGVGDRVGVSGACIALADHVRQSQKTEIAVLGAQSGVTSSQQGGPRVYELGIWLYWGIRPETRATGRYCAIDGWRFNSSAAFNLRARTPNAGSTRGQERLTIQASDDCACRGPGALTAVAAPVDSVRSA
jgi:hypothetical protein